MMDLGKDHKESLLHCISYYILTSSCPRLHTTYTYLTPLSLIHRPLLVPPPTTFLFFSSSLLLSCCSLVLFELFVVCDVVAGPCLP
jgi:hypothetical protein